jgi:hypothetical protein
VQVLDLTVLNDGRHEELIPPGTITFITMDHLPSWEQKNALVLCRKIHLYYDKLCSDH